MLFIILYGLSCRRMAGSHRLGGWVGDNLGYIGAALAYLVATIHFFHPKHGLPRLIAFVTTDNTWLLVTDPRPVAFVVSALAILVGIKLVVSDIERKLVYALGMVLMATYFLGYFAWHLTGHGGFLPMREPLYHGLHPVESVIAHLSTSPLAALSKFSEAAAFVVLAVLYRQES